MCWCVYMCVVVLEDQVVCVCQCVKMWMCLSVLLYLSVLWCSCCICSCVLLCVVVLGGQAICQCISMYICVLLCVALILYSLWITLPLPPQPGRYFLAVFAYGHSGHFGLSIGEVEWFYFSEFLLGPIYAIKGWIWTGQSVGLALIGVWVTVVGGLMILSWQGCYHRHSPRSYFNWVVCMGGFIVLSSAFVVIEELFYS